MIDTENKESSASNEYSTLTACSNPNPLKMNQRQIVGHSFVGMDAGSSTEDDYFNDTMESYKCGTNIAATFCSDVLSYSQNNPPGYTTIKCLDKTISTTKKNEWNPDYGNLDYANDIDNPGEENLVSAIILTPMDDCLQAYTMFEGPGCTGRSKVSQVSYDTSDKLQAAITAFMDLDEDGTKVVMSVSHYRGSSIEIFALEGMDDAQGSVTSDYPGEFDGETTEKICTTFQFSPTGAGRSMPQLSLKYVASHCPADEAEVQLYKVSE